MTERQYVFFPVYDKRAIDESNNHDVGLYSQFQRSRGDGMSIYFFVSVQHNYPNNLKVDALDTQFTQIYKQQTFKPYSVDGQVTGQYKNAGTFSYVCWT
jgi:hypothetical protein